MNLQNPIMFSFGPVCGSVYGGSFRAYVPTRRIFSINMAKEINIPADFRVPTEDFSVPSVSDMQHGVCAAVEAMRMGNDIYVGCMGGVGRTGLFIGCLTKVWKDFEAKYGFLYPEQLSQGDLDPVEFTRKFYKSHAIETSEQVKFVREFPTEKIVDAIHSQVYIPRPPETAGEAFRLWLRLLFR